MKPILSLCFLIWFGSFTGLAQHQGAMVFYSDLPNTTFYNNNIIEVGEYEIIFDMHADHSMGSLRSRFVVDFLGKLDTFNSPVGGCFLMKANFKTREIEAIDLGYFNYYSRTNCYLVKGDSTFYYIDPEVIQEDSMEFAGAHRVFTLPKGSKTVLAEFNFDLKLKSFSDYPASSESINGNSREAMVVKDGAILTQNKAGTRKRFDLLQAAPKVSTQGGKPSFLSLVTGADRWGAFLDGIQHNQNGTFDDGLFLSANTESIINIFRLYSVNYLYDDLSVDTLGSFESNGVFTGICDAWDPDFKWVCGMFSDALFYNYAIVSEGLSRDQPVAFVARMHSDGYLDSFQIFPDTFSSVNLSAVQGHPVVHAVVGQGVKKRLEHYLVDEYGKFVQMETVFKAQELEHWFSKSMSSGAIVSSSKADSFVRVGDDNIYAIRTGMHVISLTEPIIAQQPKVVQLEVVNTSCHEAFASWGATTHDFYTVLVSTDSILDFLPQNGQNYNFSPNYQLANKVSANTRILYQGADTSLEITSLVADRKYFFHMITGNGPAGATVYNVNAFSSAFLKMPASIYTDSLRISPASDTVFCEADTVVFQGFGTDNYTWSNGLKQARIDVSDQQQLYFLSTLPDGCLVSSDTVAAKTIVQPQISNLSANREAPYCLGDTVLLTGRSNLGRGYQWSTGDTLPTISVTQAGTYTLKSINRFCTGQKSIAIGYSSYPSFSFEADTFHIAYDSVVDLGLTTTAREWQWTHQEKTGAKSPIRIQAQTSGYVVAQGFLDSGCISRDSTYLRVYRPDSLLIPNAFTPDGDGLNDVWNISAFYGAEYYVEVYDRWGALVHLADNESKGWDGKRNGYPMPTGAYYFIVKQDGLDAVKSGCLYLLE